MTSNLTTPTTLPELLLAVMKTCRSLEPTEHFPDLKFSQFRALMVLWRDGPLSVSQLAELLDTGISAASKSADSLVVLGHVERTERVDDRRSKLLTLTPTGRELVDRMIEGRTEALTRLAVGYPDQAHLKAALADFYQYITQQPA